MFTRLTSIAFCDGRAFTNRPRLGHWKRRRDRYPRRWINQKGLSHLLFYRRPCSTRARNEKSALSGSEPLLRTACARARSEPLTMKSMEMKNRVINVQSGKGGCSPRQCADDEICAHSSQLSDYSFCSFASHLATIAARSLVAHTYSELIYAGIIRSNAHYYFSL